MREKYGTTQVVLVKACIQIQDRMGGSMAHRIKRGKDGLTGQEARQLVRLVGKMNYPYRESVFRALCRYLIGNPVEFILLTRDGKVRLERRKHSDPFFANQWACPGSMQWFGQMVPGVQARILKRELGGMTCSAPEFFDWEDIPYGTGEGQNPRGQERTLHFIVWVSEDASGKGEFFDLYNLPEDLISFHRPRLERVREKFFPKET